MEPVSRVFLTYAQEDLSFVNELLSHLSSLKRNKQISVWHKNQIVIGEDWKEHTIRELEKADVVFLIVSAGFLASEKVWENELHKILETKEKKEIEVIPIIARPCHWQNSIIAQFDVLPNDGKAITLSENRDEVWANLVDVFVKKTLSRKAPDLHWEYPSVLRKKLRLQSKSYHHHFQLNQLKGFTIQDNLLTYPHTFDNTVTSREERTGIPLVDCIESIWDDGSKHIFLLGEGGMGKTTSCIRAWEHYCDIHNPYQPIPFFISLSNYNIYEGERFIPNQLRRDYEVNWDDFITLANETPPGSNPNNPNIILFLDGYNEITKRKRELDKEVFGQLCSKFKRIQVVISSRFLNRKDWNSNSFQEFRLLPLEKEQIQSFLKPQTYPASPRIQILLAIPLYLSLYDKITGDLTTEEKELEHKDIPYYLKENKEIETGGELLIKYLSQVLISDYRNKSYIDIDEEFREEWAKKSFFIRHFLPFVGYQMTFHNKDFSISPNDLEGFVSTFKELIVHPQFQIVFPYCKRYLKTKFETDFSIKNIIKTCVSEIAILNYIRGERLQFSNQIFRDFFASLHILNSIPLLNSINGLKKINEKFHPLQKQILPVSIRKFIGEIAQEHYNVPIVQDNKWSVIHYRNTPLRKELERWRGKFTSPNIENTVNNILLIWQEVKGDFSGENLDNLNLVGFDFADIQLSRRNGKDKYLTCTFKDSRANIEDFFKVAHKPPPQFVRTFSIDFLKYANDGSQLTSRHYDEVMDFDRPLGYYLNSQEIKWDTTNGKPIKSPGYTLYPSPAKIILEPSLFHTNQVVIYAESPDNKYLISILRHRKGPLIRNGEFDEVYYGNFYQNGLINCYNTPGIGTIQIWNGEGQFIRRFSTNEDGWTAISKRDYLIARASQNSKTIIISNYDNGNDISSIISDEIVKCVAFSHDGRKVLSISQNGKVQDWSLESKEVLNELALDVKTETILDYIPDDEHIITTSFYGQMSLWNLKTGQKVRAYLGHTTQVSAIAFHPTLSRFVTGTRAFNNFGNRDDHGRGSISIKEWDLITSECLHTYQDTFLLHNRRVLYQDDGKQFLISLLGGVINEYESKNLKVTHSIKTNITYPYCVEYGKAGRNVLIAGINGDFEIWDNFLGVKRKSFKGVKYGFPVGVLAPTKQLVAYTGTDIPFDYRRINKQMSAKEITEALKLTKTLYRIAIADLNKEKDFISVLNYSTYIGEECTCIQFSPDTRYLAAGNKRGCLMIWDLHERKSFKVGIHDGHINSIFFLSDSDTEQTSIVTSGNDGKIVLSPNIAKNKFSEYYEICDVSPFTAYSLGVTDTGCLSIYTKSGGERENETMQIFVFEPNDQSLQSILHRNNVFPLNTQISLRILSEDYHHTDRKILSLLKVDGVQQTRFSEATLIERGKSESLNEETIIDYGLLLTGCMLPRFNIETDEQEELKKILSLHGAKFDLDKNQEAKHRSFFDSLRIFKKNVDPISQSEDIAITVYELDLHSKLLDNLSHFKQHIAKEVVINQYLDLDILINTGTMYYEDSNWDQALSYFNSALEYCEKHLPPESEVLTYNNAKNFAKTGAVYFKKDQIEKGRDSYKACFKLIARLLANENKYEAEVAGFLNDYSQGLLGAYGKEGGDIELLRDAIATGFHTQSILKRAKGDDIEYQQSRLNSFMSLVETVYPGEKQIMFTCAGLQQILLLAQSKDMPNNLKVEFIRKTLGDLEAIPNRPPDHPTAVAILASGYASLSWYLIFEKEFIDAEKAALKSLEIKDNDSGWINLALATLLQDRREEALKLYKELWNKPYTPPGHDFYKEVFLTDLDEIEEAGIFHPDINLIRDLNK